MDESEIRKFLQDGSIPLRLAMIEKDGDPVIYPVWFHFEDDRIYFFTGKNSRKVGNLSRSNRVYFCIDSEGQPYKGVKGKASVAIVTQVEKAQGIAGNIIKKYLGNLNSSYAKTMIDGVKSGKEIVVELDPVYYSTWD